MLPFRRIAILEPTLVFPRSVAVMSDKEIRMHAVQWAEIALSKGADAFYFRFHRDYDQLPLILEALAEKAVRYLIPYPVREHARPEDAVHHRGSDALTVRMTPQMDLQEAIDRSPNLRGRSCHTLQELRAAEVEGFDYAFFSPIFPTQTHPEATPVGMEKLQAACAQVKIPIFALGGITTENESQCLEAGAAGIAAIRMFFS